MENKGYIGNLARDYFKVAQAAHYKKDGMFEIIQSNQKEIIDFFEKNHTLKGLDLRLPWKAGLHWKTKDLIELILVEGAEKAVDLAKQEYAFQTMCKDESDRLGPYMYRDKIM